MIPQHKASASDAQSITETEDICDAPPGSMITSQRFNPRRMFWVMMGAMTLLTALYSRIVTPEVKITWAHVSGWLTAGLGVSANIMMFSFTEGQQVVKPAVLNRRPRLRWLATNFSTLSIFATLILIIPLIEIFDPDKIAGYFNFGHEVGLYGAARALIHGLFIALTDIYVINRGGRSLNRKLCFYTGGTLRRIAVFQVILCLGVIGGLCVVFL